MTKSLVELIAHFAVFLESADESMIALDSATQLQEEMAFRLQKLSPGERAEFLNLLTIVAEEEPCLEARDILQQLPSQIGWS